MIDLTIVVPVYNEADRIEGSINRLVSFFKEQDLTFEVILAVDPSPDHSEILCDTIAGRYDCVRVVHFENRNGRGRAVRESWQSSNAKYYAFIDADLSSDEKTLLKAYEIAEKTKCNILTGSRYYIGSNTYRPPLRKVVSFSYNKLLNVVFKEHITDHQCGLKIIDKITKDRILSFTKVDSWFWDTELLVTAERYGLKISEFPVNWEEKKYNRTSFRRLLKDLLIHGWGVILLYKRFRNFDSKKPPNLNAKREFT